MLLPDRYLAPCNSRRGSSTLVPDTLKFAAVFAIAALAAIVFASNKIEIPNNAKYASTFYGP